MAGRYLTLDYLETLLRFVVEEHIEFVHGEEFYEGKCDKLIDKIYHEVAEKLWGDSKIQSKETKKGRKAQDEDVRLNMVLDQMKRYNLTLNAASTLIAKTFPVRSITEDALKKRLERAYNKKTKSAKSILNQEPMFSIHNRIPDGFSEADLRRDGIESRLPKLLSKIEEKLRRQ